MITAQTLPKIGTAPVGSLEISDIPSIAELRAIITGNTSAGADSPRPALESGSIANVTGYATQNDGGGGVFIFDAYSVVADDGGYVISPTNGLGRWIRQGNGQSASVKFFGAKGDGVADDTAAINLAIDYALANGVPEVFFPSGDYLYAGTKNIVTVGALTFRGVSSKQTTGKASRVLINHDGVIFTVNSFSGFGTDADRVFNLSNLAFVLLNPNVNVNCTFFYVAYGILFGSCINSENCWFDSFTNCAIQVIRGTQCHFVGNKFFGVSAGWGAINWAATARDDAAIRLWGADGSATLQDHSFCNLVEIRNNKFSYVRRGIDGWGIHSGFSVNNTFEFTWIGFFNAGSDPAILGMVVSTQKAGYGGGQCTSICNWYESTVKYHLTFCDINNASGADVNPTRRTYYTCVDNFFNDNAQLRANLGYFNDGTNHAVIAQLPLAAPLGAKGGVMDNANDATTRITCYGPDNATNGKFQIISCRADGSSPIIYFNADGLGNLYRSGAFTPQANLVPAFIGEEFLDTATARWFKSGDATAFGWTQISN